MSDEIARVKPESEMDNETFLQHMNKRHKGAAGIQHWGKSNVPDDESEDLLRKMHAVLHKDYNGNYGPFDHTHREDKK